MISQQPSPQEEPAGPAAATGFDPLSEPTDQEVAAYVRKLWIPVLVRRARATIIILLVATAAFTASALWVLPVGKRGVIVTHVVHAIWQVALYVALSTIRRPEIVEWVPVAGGIATSWIIAWGAILSGRDITTALLVPGYLLGSAALMPWGLSRHYVLATGAVAALITNVYVIHGGFLFSAGYFVSIPALSLAATSLYIAYEFDRTRMEAGREELRRQRAEAAMLSMNASLEARVAARTAELQRAVEELRTFSYTVSHDLRAPLRSINGFSQTLSDEFAEVLGDDGLFLLGRVRAASNRMGEMIDAMLTLGRVTSTQLRRGSVDLAQMARTIADELDSADPGRKVRWKLSDSLHADGDPTLLRMLMANLLTNAHKFTRGVGGAWVELGMTSTNEGPAYFVRDNGVGFDMDHAQHLFEEFHRLHSDSSYEGTGVGLATVRRIVQRHGGKVWAQSEPGAGATFYFTLGQMDGGLADSDTPMAAAS